MELGRLVRATRRGRGWSQRDLARASGLSRSTVARWEGAEGSAEVGRLLRAVATAGVDLALALPATEPDDVTRTFLRGATSQRLLEALGGHGPVRQHCALPVWRALGRAAPRRTVVLAPEACTGVWLPGVRAPEPLPVSMPALTAEGARPWTDEPTLAVTVGPVQTAGLVPVGVTSSADVLVYPPDHPLMALDPFVSARLRGVAELLDQRAVLDDAQRRSAAHRDSDVRREEGIVVSLTRYKRVRSPDPDARDRRDWRLGGEATFEQWLGRRGFPRLRG